MPIKRLGYYTRKLVQSRPNSWFIFGDNEARRGYKGQAMACRGEGNAIGITTKISPCMDDPCFYDDDDFERWFDFNDSTLQQIDRLLINGQTIYYPVNGIGTGLSQLAFRAPTILKAIDVFITERE